MEIFIAQLVSGLATGSIYAVIVIGMNLLVLVTGMTHYAYAHVVVFAMYIAWSVISMTGNMAIGFAAGFGSALALSIGIEPLFRPLLKRYRYFSALIVSVALALVLTDIEVHFFNFGLPISFPRVLETGWADLRIGLVSFPVSDIVTLVGAVGAVLGFIYFLYRRNEGRAFRAIAQSRRTAHLLGIPVDRINFLSFVIGGLLAGTSVIMLILAIGFASPALGNNLALKALALLLFAGIGNLRGGLISAYILGIAEAMATGYLPAQWAPAIAFAMIAIVILIRPQGLFGTRV
jgi:branched-chain amino acid transport system permease protein